MLYTVEQALSLKEQTFAHLIVTQHDHVLNITLNRPEKKNAMNDILFRELAFALEHAYHNHEVWAVVIDAKGDIFCAGADLKAFAGQAQENNSTIPVPEGEVVLADVFSSVCKPTIAKVHAPVFAGGFLIVCGCTHVIASSNATFALPEVKRGLYPFQVMQSMLQIMPTRVVLDFCMRARSVNAHEAKALGLISDVVEPAELDAAVDALIADIMQYSPSAIRLGLEAFNDLKRMPAAESQKHMKQMLGEALKTEDAAEGLQAFIEKRKPVWKGK